MQNNKIVYNEKKKEMKYVNIIFTVFATTIILNHIYKL